jgi:hypothetical protein
VEATLCADQPVANALGRRELRDVVVGLENRGGLIAAHALPSMLYTG